MSDEVSFGRYTLEKRLAVGGMAEVFVGRVDGPDGFHKRVVIKRILSSLGEDDRYVQMFLDEARLAARFDHPNLVHIYELTKVGEQYALVMEYIHGIDLDEVVERCYRDHRPIPLDIGAWVIAEAAEGLHWAHELTDDRGGPLGVVHRDVSPANVILTWNGRVKVVDFGIAKHRQSTTETESGVLKGKYSYMSPEQAQGRSVDRRSDLFSLGTVFYELLTLERCFTRKTPMETLRAVTDAEYSPVSRYRPEVPPELVDIVDRMLALQPADRFASCAEVSARLRQFLSSRVVPQSNDVGLWLERVFGHAGAPLHGRGYTAMSSDEVEVDDHLSLPTVTVSRDDYDRLVEVTHAVPFETARLRQPQPLSDESTSTVPDAGVEAGTVIAPGYTEIVELAPARPPPVRVAAVAALLTGLVVLIVVARSLDTEPAAPPASAPAPSTGASAASLAVPEPPAALRSAPATVLDRESEPAASEPTPSDPQGLSPGPRSAAIGYLSLVSEPAAEVLIDGRKVGSTPLRDLALPAGRRSAVVRNTKLGLSRTMRIDIPAGRSVAKRVVFPTGKVALQVSPWADVYLRGDKIGTTPMAPFALYEGVHDLELVNPNLGVRRLRRISVRAGQTVKVIESLE